MKYRLLKCILTAAIILSVLLGYYFVRETTGISVICPFYSLTGLYCPGCGMTRMCTYLLNGEIYKAFRSNCLAFILIIPIGVCILSMLWEYVFFKHISKRADKTRTYFLKFISVLLIFYWIIRNIPAFLFLAPI